MGNVPPINGNRLGLEQTNTHTHTHGGYHGRSAGRSESSIVSTTNMCMLILLGFSVYNMGPPVDSKVGLQTIWFMVDIFNTLWFISIGIQYYLVYILLTLYGLSILYGSILRIVLFYCFINHPCNNGPTLYSHSWTGLHKAGPAGPAPESVLHYLSIVICWLILRAD